MSNPYKNRPDYTFWKRSMSARGAGAVDPVTSPRFTISKSDKVATAGSCFAQHISKTLVSSGFSFFVTEQSPNNAPDPSYGIFPARFANIYTTRQLLQLFQRAYGQFEPIDSVWRRADGKFIDPFRPRITTEGFSTEQELFKDRETHLAAVREMFESCNVFIFTLGLTEGWESAKDNAVFPLAPGVVAEGTDPSMYRFHNFTVSEVTADLRSFITQIKMINPDIRILLTVSPVPLVATYEDKHVLTSTTYSKSVLRVAAENALTMDEDVDYFPSYEIITGPHSRGSFYEEDLREVTPEGVRHVMGIFSKHYMIDSPDQATPLAPAKTKISADEAAAIKQLEDTICDEDYLGTQS